MASSEKRGLEVREYGTGTGSRLLVAADGMVVARVDDVALAQLFAAAPELYDAVHELLAAHLRSFGVAPHPVGCSICRIGRAAIAKATAEPGGKP